jgi:hypothetical protein
MAMTIQAVAIDLLSKLGLDLTDPTTADTISQQDVIVAMNAAFQRLQTAGEDYFTRQIETVPIIAGTSIYTLAPSVQNILGPIRLNNQIPLKALTSKGEVDQFDRIFEGQSDYGSGPGQPIAYYVESLFNLASAGDIDTINIYLCPVPTAPGFLSIEYINNSISFTTAMIGGTTIIPCAQNYTESIFLPIARMFITRSRLFSRPDILEGIKDDYQLAMQILGMAGGFPPEAEGTPDRETTG